MPKDMTVEELAEDIKASHGKAFDAVKEIAENALGKAEAGEELSGKAKEAADEALLKMNELGEQLSGLQQKMARGGGADHEGRKTLGQRFVEDEGVKEFLAKGASSGKAQIMCKATLTSLTTDAAGSVGDGIAPDRMAGDGYTGRLGRCILRQKWALPLIVQPDVVCLPFPDCREFKVERLVDGVWTEVDAVTLALFENQVSLSEMPDDWEGLHLTCYAGWESADKVPGNLKQAVRLLVAHWFDSRSAVAIG